MDHPLQIVVVLLAVSVGLGWVTRSVRFAIGAVVVFGIAVWLDTVEPVADWVRSVQRERWFAFAKGAAIFVLISVILGARADADPDDPQRIP